MGCLERVGAVSRSRSDGLVGDGKLGTESCERRGNDERVRNGLERERDVSERGTHHQR